MIEFRQVSKRYTAAATGTTVLQDISLTINPGEVFGIIGQSGAGKSTLLRLINQLERPSSGQILIEGADTLTLNAGELKKIRQQSAFIFQQFNLLHNLTVLENVALPLKLQGKKDLQGALDMLDFVKLGHKVDLYPSQLSGGEKQRVAIARALSLKPKILLCDEPTSALDEEHAGGIIELIQDVHREFQPTIVLVSHEFAVIKALCSRAAILENGQLLEVMPVQQAQAVEQFASYHDRAKELLSR